MKVLFITNYGTLYGANRCLLELMIWLKDKYSITPIVLVSGKTGPFGVECKEQGIQCINHNFRNRTVESDIKNKTLRRTTRFWMRYVDYIKVFNYLKRTQVEYDIVHTNSSIMDIGVFLARWARVPHVWHIREFLDISYNMEIVYGEKLLKKYYFESKAIIAISDVVFNSISAIDKNINLHKISDGINIVEPYDKVYFSDNKLNICMVGSIQEAKNQMDVLKAIKILPPNKRSEVRLYIVGDESGDYYDSLVQYMEDNGLEKNVIFTGYKSDVNDVLKLMDVGIMASNMEAFGRVTVEYMANYMIVFASNTGANVEFLDEKKLFELHDTVGIAHLIDYAMANKSDFKEIGVKNRKLAEKYSSERNADEIEKIYKHIVIR